MVRLQIPADSFKTGRALFISTPILKRCWRQKVSEATSPPCRDRVKNRQQSARNDKNVASIYGSGYKVSMTIDLKLYGPLAFLAGTWRGSIGDDTAPDDDR